MTVYLVKDRFVIEGDDLVCPTCKARNSIIEQDSCVRWNRGEVYRAEDGTFVLDVNQSQVDFETDHYLCGECYKELDVPTTLAVTWS